jgi:hypothetical protein
MRILDTHPRSSESHEHILRLVQSDIGKVARVELDSSGRRGRLDLGLYARLLGDAGCGAVSDCAISLSSVVFRGRLEHSQRRERVEITSAGVVDGLGRSGREPFERYVRVSTSMPRHRIQ